MTRRIGHISVLLIAIVLFSGCAAIMELFTFEGLAARAIITEGMAARVAVAEGVAARTSAFGGRALLLEEEAVASRALQLNELRAGRLVLTSETSFNSLLGEMRLVRVGGRNPSIYVKGRATPIGELLENERAVKLANGSMFAIDRNIMSVQGDVVNVRSSTATIADANIITKLERGSMVTYLGEVENGWYKVEVIDGTTPKIGYMDGALLLPLISTDTFSFTAYSQLELKKEVIPFPTREKVKEDIVKAGLPDWEFKSPSEIKRLKTYPGWVRSNLCYYIDVELDLYDYKTRKECQARVKVRYEVQKNKWQYSGIYQSLFYVENEGIYPQKDYSPKAIGFVNNKYAYNNNPSSDYHSNIDKLCTLKISVSNNEPISIEINGRRFKKHGRTLFINDLPCGRHYIKIYSSPQVQKSPKLLFKGTIDLSHNVNNTAVYPLNTKKLIVN